MILKNKWKSKRVTQPSEANQEERVSRIAFQHMSKKKLSRKFWVRNCKIQHSTINSSENDFIITPKVTFELAEH